jgi:hypothetical protein
MSPNGRNRLLASLAPVDLALRAPHLVDAAAFCVLILALVHKIYSAHMHSICCSC